jgi:hypothetical protein
VGIVSAGTLHVIDMLVGNRVSQQTEIEGLDDGEMGMPGYVAEPDRAFPPEMGKLPDAVLVTEPIQERA